MGQQPKTTGSCELKSTLGIRVLVSVLLKKSMIALIRVNYYTTLVA